MVAKRVIQVAKRNLSRLLLTLVCLSTAHQAMCGDTVDSLYRAFINADKPQRIKLVNMISRQLYKQEVTDSLYLCDASTRDDVVEGLARYLIGEHYYDKGQYDEALENGLQARNNLSRVKPGKLQSDVLGLVSNAQYRTGDLDEALKTLLEAYELDKKLNDKELISSDLNSMAAIYLAAEQPAQGLKFIEKSIAIERELNRPERIAIRLGMASELYLMNADYDKAMEAIMEAYRLDHQGGREEKAAIRLVQKAAIQHQQALTDEARLTLNQALPILEQADNSYSLAVAHNQLGAIEQQCGNQQDAVAHYKRALELSINCGSKKSELAAERGLWETLRERDPAKALIHLERYAALNDSLQLEKASIKFKVSEFINQNDVQTKLDNKSRLASSIILWGGGALVVMLMGMIAGLFYSWRKGKSALKMQQQAQEMKSHFFSNITNKLQSPLTVVMSAGQHLLESGKVSAAENRRLGEMIVNHGQSMLSLVNQLLDIEQVKTGINPPESKHGDIVMFVKMLVDNYTDKANQQMINLEFLSPLKTLMVVFTPDYMRKIVHSLIDNAIKFTPRNGKISVELSLLEEGMMRLVVSDTGKGIPLEERSRMFDPFSQPVDSDDGASTALGLSLVNMLVQALKGSITIDSELGQGTTFTIDFPVQAIEKAGATQQFAERRVRRSDGTNRQPLVFIVENNEDVAFFIASHLSKKFNLRFARDGREALQIAQNMVPELIITNIKMPVMDGKELMNQVRHNPSLNHIPIIAMTSVTGEQERISCIECGADAVLVKPFNSDELKLTADHLIGQRSLLRERYEKTGDPISADTTNAQMSKADKEFINKLVDIIHAHMATDDINIEHIAAAMSLSAKQLRTRVMAITGVTPVAFILQVRLHYARHIIGSENISLTAIATKCGFQNLSHFSKAFKQQFGISPLQFRKIIEDGGHIPLNNDSNPTINH